MAYSESRLVSIQLSAFITIIGADSLPRRFSVGHVSFSSPWALLALVEECKGHRRMASSLLR